MHVRHVQVDDRRRYTVELGNDGKLLVCLEHYHERTKKWHPTKQGFLTEREIGYRVARAILEVLCESGYLD